MGVGGREHTNPMDRLTSTCIAVQRKLAQQRGRERTSVCECERASERESESKRASEQASERGRGGKRERASRHMSTRRASTQRASMRTSRYASKCEREGAKERERERERQEGGEMTDRKKSERLLPNHTDDTLLMRVTL